HPQSFIDPPHTCYYPLSLHDALPIFRLRGIMRPRSTPHRTECDKLWRNLYVASGATECPRQPNGCIANRQETPFLAGLRRKAAEDRKSTRLNSSHVKISYAVFCLKKK